MTLATVGQFYPIPAYGLGAANGGNTIDAADEAVGYITPVKAGNIVAVHWRTGSVTTGATVDVRIETVGTTGLPTGTLWSATTNALQVVLSTDDNLFFRTVLTLPAAVILGDILAVVIANPTVSFGDMTLLEGMSINSASNIGLPYITTPTRATKATGSLLCALEYDDGSYNYCLTYPPFFRTLLSINTGSNPDEVSLYFTPDVPMRIFGCSFLAGLAAGADYRIGLYESGNNTPLLTKTMDGDITVVASSHRQLTILFTAMQTLAAGTTYRLAILPLTANSVTINYFDAPTAAVLASLHTANIQYSSRNRTGTTDPDAAAWTEVATRVLSMWPLCDQLDDGAGAGGESPGSRHYPAYTVQRGRASYGA